MLFGVILTLSLVCGVRRWWAWWRMDGAGVGEMKGRAYW